MEIEHFSQTVKKNLVVVQQRIDDAAKRSGRTAEDVKMVAVTKYLDGERTAEMLRLGCRDLGESRPQILWDKANQLTDPDVRWHQIGHLQRNKAKRTLAIANLVHSVDSERLMNSLNEIATESDQVCDILLEINVSGDENKGGFAIFDVNELLGKGNHWPALNICGLMCMGGLASDDSQVRSEFERLRITRDMLQQRYDLALPELSMGMSGDFEIAIEEGATIVRIGSILYEGAI